MVLLLLEFLGKGNVFQGLVVLNARICLHVVASLGNLPHGPVPGSRIVIVQTLGFQKGLDSMRRLQGIVMRHFMEQVVCHMGRSNAVMEKVKNSIRTINSAQGTLDPGPFSISIVRYTGVAVLQPSVEDQPSVGDKVGVPVPEKDGKEPHLGTRIEKTGKGKDSRPGRQENLEGNLFRKHGRGGTKVVRDASIEGFALLIDLSSGRQTEQVERPSDRQVRVDLKGRKGPISHGLVPGRIKGISLLIRAQSIVLSGGRHVRFSIRQVIRPTMVLGVRVLPGKVRDEQGLVHDKAHHVVPALRGRKGAVPAFVRHDPGARPDGSLPKGVKGPAGHPLGEFGRI